MLRFQILTLFPDLFEQFCSTGLVGRGVREGLISIDTSFLRDFAINAQGQVDDTPYGGGSGMVLRPEPAVSAIERAKQNDLNAKVVLFTPRGKVLNRKLARELHRDCSAQEGGLILLCPRYEGVDERITNWVDVEISLGDFVLMGGEIPSMALIEAVSRFVPGVLGNPESLKDESFENGLLEYPQYTKPQDYAGLEVPSVLLSGHHQEIASWRAEQSERDTKIKRPDLWKKHAPRLPSCELDVALIHYPVHDKKGEIITSSVTNLDLHDISRSAKTFGINHLYVVHPVKALRRLMQKICEHWASGHGFTYNHNRSEALDLISLVPDFDDVLLDIETRTGAMPKIVATSAKRSNKSTTFSELSQILSLADDPHLILLGTGWGLAEDILSRADYHLEPICGHTDYNHLSVRAAAAIIFDRLFGKGG